MKFIKDNNAQISIFYASLGSQNPASVLFHGSRFTSPSLPKDGAAESWLKLLKVEARGLRSAYTGSNELSLRYEELVLSCFS